MLNISAVLGCKYGPDDSPVFAEHLCTAREAAPSLINGYANDASGLQGQGNAFKVTVDNPNAYPVSVSEVTVGFYDVAGSEISQSPETLAIIQIAAGRSVSYVYSSGIPTGAVRATAESWSP